MIKFKDFWLAAFLFISLYNFCLFIFIGAFQYINLMKIIWILGTSFFASVPVSLIAYYTLKIKRSFFFFFLFSVILWLIWPFSGMLLNIGSDLNYNIGGKPIYINGDLTYYGYINGLKSSFLVPVIWSSILMMQEIIQKIKKGIIIVALNSYTFNSSSLLNLWQES